MISGNWSGYTAVRPDGSFSGITAQWDVPSVVPDNTKYLCEWIGIDGAANNTLIQDGTETDGNGNYYAWIEFLPAAQKQIVDTNGGLVPVKPGDVMFSYIAQSSSNTWRMYLQDLTQNWTFNQTYTYDTPGASAEWITEATQENGQFTYPANFGSMWYDYMEIASGSQWYVTSYADSERYAMIPAFDGNAAANPTALGTFNGYQYFYDEYTGT